MKTIRLLHLGDIHYPDEQSRGPAVDVKDRAFPERLIYQIAANQLRNSIEAVTSLVAAGEIQGLLFSGDLTTQASLPGYQDCLRFLKGVLGNLAIWNEGSINVVPGNHDVDWAELNEAAPFAQFDCLSDAWRAVGLDVLDASSVRRTLLGAHGQNVAVYSINSCVGCGSTRSLPARLRQSIADAIRGHSAEAERIHSLLAITEQLDTPAFLEAHLTELGKQLREEEAGALPIILGHHGILPQAVPRIDLYTEVINGGLARFRLTEIGRPIVYCHGHIHADPVEIVQQPELDGSKLVLVAAPLLRDGFNELRIYFSSDALLNGDSVALGCEVIRHKVQSHGSVRAEPAIRVPFLASPNLAHCPNEKAQRICARLSDDYVRFGNAYASASGVLEISESEYSATIIEMEWLGLIEVVDRSRPYRQWMIRKTSP